MVMLYGLTDSVRYLKKWFKVNLTEHLSENGYYENNPDKNHENISDEKGKIRVEFHTAGMTEANIVYNRALLFRAIGLCKNAGVVPFLITTPVYHTYRDHMDHDKYDRMQKVIRDLCEKTGTKYFNYLDDPRFDIDDFSDNDHLNACGAEKFSTILDQEVLRHLEKNAVQNKTCP